MAEQTTERFMNALQEAERTGNVDPLVGLFSDDAEAANLAITAPLKGRDQIRRFWQDYLNTFKQVSSKFTNVIEGDGAAIMEWVSEGALPTGDPITYRGVSIIEKSDGHVRRFMTYYDSAAFLPQGAKR